MRAYNAVYFSLLQLTLNKFYFVNVDYPINNLAHALNMLNWSITGVKSGCMRQFKRVENFNRGVVSELKVRTEFYKLSFLSHANRPFKYVSLEFE